MKGMVRAIATGICLVLAFPAFAGVTITDEDGTVTYLSNGRLASKPAEAGAMVHMFDANRGQMTLVDPRNRTYAEGSVQEYCTVMKSMQATVQSQMSPEQRKMMQQFLGQTSGEAKHRKVTVKDEGDGGRILGYPTRRYGVYVNGRPYEELWLTTDRRLLSSAGDYKKLMKMSAQLTACVASEMGAIAGPSVEQSAAYRKVMEKGWELRSVSRSDGTRETHQVKAIEIGHIPDSRFAVPAGYRRMKLETMMKAGYSME